MARQRKIAEQDAIEAAKAAFWQYGYQALGTRQLEAETGITRFTLQTAFGGKMALFERALDAYLDDMQTMMLPGMADGTLDGLARWFEVRCDAAMTPEAGKWGCLMIDSIAEFGGTSPQINARAERFETMLRKAFGDTLEQIEDAGGLSGGLNQGGAVEMLVAASIGLNVKIRSAGDCAAGRPMAAGIAAVIRGWGNVPHSVFETT